MEGIENIRSLSIDDEESQLDIAFKKAPAFVQIQMLKHEVEKLSGETLNNLCDGYWSIVTMNGLLSSEFVRKYSDRLDWEYISGDWTLSVEFMREFADRLNWDYVSWRQPLSDAFVLEFADRLNLEELLNNVTYLDLSPGVRQHLGMDGIIARLREEDSEDSDDSGYDSVDSEDEVPPPGEGQ